MNVKLAADAAAAPSGVWEMVFVCRMKFLDRGSDLGVFHFHRWKIGMAKEMQEHLLAKYSDCQTDILIISYKIELFIWCLAVLFTKCVYLVLSGNGKFKETQMERVNLF